MKQQVVKLLALSYTSQGNEELRRVTQNLHVCDFTKGYIPVLTQIILDLNTDESTTFAALVQLKNCLRKRQNWKFNQKNQYLYFQEDENILKQQIFQVNTELIDNKKYSKLVKDIITIIGRDVLERSQNINLDLEKSFEVKSCLNFLLGLIDNCKDLSHDETSIKKSIAFVENEVFVLKKLFLKSQLPDQLLYLVIKFMKKSLSFVRNLPVRQCCFEWARYCLDLLGNRQDYKNCPNVQELYISYDQQNSAFMYFHLKKWIIKFMICFTDKMLVKYQSNTSLKEMTQTFQNNYWSVLIKVVQKLFTEDSPKKVRLYEFKLLEMCFRKNPQLMFPQFDYFMFEVIPNFIYLQPKDVELAIQNPVGFISMEQSEQASSEIRITAENLWKKVLSIYFSEDYQKVVQKYELCFQFVQKFIQNEGTIYVATRLFIKLSQEIKIQHMKQRNIWSQFRQSIKKLSQKLIPELFRSENCILVSLGLQIFSTNSIVISQDVKKTTAQYIKYFLSDESFTIQGRELVRIKSLEALGHMPSEIFKQVESHIIEEFLMCYIKYFQKYEFEYLLRSFKNFVEHTSKQIQHVAVVIVKCLSEQFRTKFQADYNEDEDLTSLMSQNVQKVLSNYIEILQNFCEMINPQTIQIQQILEEELKWMMNLLLGSNIHSPMQVINEYQPNILQFLQRYILSLRKYRIYPSPHIHVYMNTILLKILGLPEEEQELINQQYFEDSVYKNMLLHCASRDDLNLLKKIKIFIPYLYFLNFQESIRPPEVTSSLLSGTTFIEKIFIWFAEIYEQPQQNAQEIDEFQAKGKIGLTILSIYLLEEHRETMCPEIYKTMWKAAINNFKSKQLSKYLKSFNLQLIFLLISINGINLDRNVLQLITHIVKHNKLEIKDSQQQENSYYPEEILRALLGLSTFLKMALSHQPLMDNVKTIMKWFIFYMQQFMKDSYSLKLPDNEIDFIQTNPTTIKEKFEEYEEEEELLSLSDKEQLYEFCYNTILEKGVKEETIFVGTLMTIYQHQPMLYMSLFSEFQQIESILVKLKNIQPDVTNMLLNVSGVFKERK